MKLKKVQQILKVRTFFVIFSLPDTTLPTNQPTAWRTGAWRGKGQETSRKSDQGKRRRRMQREERKKMCGISWKTYVAGILTLTL